MTEIKMNVGQNGAGRGKVGQNGVRGRVPSPVDISSGKL